MPDRIARAVSEKVRYQKLTPEQRSERYRRVKQRRIEHYGLEAVLAYAAKYNREKNSSLRPATCRRLAIIKDPIRFPARKLFYSARCRAKELCLPFDLEPSDITIPGKCPVLGIAMLRGKGKLHDGSPTLDRIVPALGYVKGNVAVISHRANRIKQNATADELIKIAEWMRRHAQ